jgi:hypothetical protein
MQGIDAADLDMAKGGALALTLEKDSPMPNMTSIVPVRDEKAAPGKIKAKNPNAAVETAGGYAAVNPEGAYKKGGVPKQLAAPLPAGDLIVRVDMAALSKTFGPKLIAEAESSLGDGPEAAAPKQMIAGLKSAMDAMSVLDLALRANGATLEIDSTMTFVDRAKAPFLDYFGKGDLPGLARYVPNEGMMSMALAFDPEKAWPALLGMMTSVLSQLEPAAQASMKKLFDQAGQMSKFWGKTAVATGGFSPNGLEFIYAIDSSDPPAMIKAMTGLLASVDLKDAPFTFSAPEERTIDGTKLTTFHLKADPSKMPAGGTEPEKAAREAAMKMYGKDGLTYSIADFGKRVMIVIGDDEVVKRGIKAEKAGNSEGAFSKQLADAGADTFLHARIDMRAMMRGVKSMMPEKNAGSMPPIPAGDPVIMTMTGNASGNVLRFRMSFDVGGFAKLFNGPAPK